MTKKALKSLEADVRKPRGQNKITFNKSSFSLGSLLVITDQLKKQTRDILIEQYKNGKFNKDVQNQKPLINPLDAKKKYIILTQSHALQIIKDTVLAPIHQFQASLGTIEGTSITEKNSTPFSNNNPSSRPSFYSRMKQLFSSRKESSSKSNMQEILHEKQSDDEKLKTIIQTKCLQVDRQIFIKSIVMIVQKQLEIENPDQEISTKSIVVFEQPYPFKQFDKSELNSMIGDRNYQKKLLAGLKIYHYSITNQKFSNPLFQTCHQCMKVKSSLEYPQNSLFCSKKLESGENKYISSKYVYSPFSYMKKIIQKDHFNSQDQPFTHSYLQYHARNFGENGLSCNRRWCGFCVINGRKDMNIQQCEFCDFACRCLRCKKFEKLTKILAHYFNYGGEYSEIRPKFLFSQVFDSQHFNYEPKKNKSTFFNRYTFPYIDELRKTYEINQLFFHATNQWNKLPNSSLISGSKPETKRQFEMIQENWEKEKIQIKKNPNQFEDHKKNKNNKKTHGSIKAQNIEAKINNLSEETKKKFIEAANQQERMLATELVRSGVIKSSNPLENPAFKMKKERDIMLQQTELQKKENKFYSTVPIVEWKGSGREGSGQFMGLNEREKEKKK